MGLRRILRFVISTIRAPTRQVQHLAEIREGIANLTKVTVQRQLELTAGVRNLTQVIDQANKRSGASDRQLQNAINHLNQTVAGIEKQFAPIIDEANSRVSSLLDIANTLSVSRSEDGSQREPLANLVDKLVAGLDNQSELINRRAGEILEQQQDLAKTLVEIAVAEVPPSRPPTTPLTASLAMPQFSLRRPDPIADLAVTKEYAEYVKQFADVKSAGEGAPGAEDLSVLYALARKLAPSEAVALADGSEIEAIARALADNAKGRLGVFGAGHKSSALADSLSANVSAHVDFRGGTVDKSTLANCTFGYVNASAKGGDMNPAVVRMLENIGAGGVVAIGGSADDARALVQKALAGNANWSVLGAGASKPRPPEIRLIALMRN